MFLIIVLSKKYFKIIYNKNNASSCKTANNDNICYYYIEKKLIYNIISILIREIKLKNQ